MSAPATLAPGEARDPRDARTRLLLQALHRVQERPAEQAPMAIDLATLAPRRVLALAPHADDEVLGCGGLLHCWSAAGAEVTVLVLTREGARSIGDASSEDGVATRVREAARAQWAIGYRAGVHLGFEERTLARHVAGGELAAAIRRCVERAAPECVVAPGARELHPDHRAACVALLHALRARARGGASLPFLLLYDVWGRCERVDATVRLTAAAVAALRAAMGEYRTQLRTADYQAVLTTLHETGAVGAATGGGCAPREWSERYERLASLAELEDYLARVAREPAWPGAVAHHA